MKKKHPFMELKPSVQPMEESTLYAGPVAPPPSSGGRTVVCRFKTTSWTWEITKQQIKTEAAMPLYEYFCKKCKKKFGGIFTVKEHDTRKMHCPKCKSEDVEKVIEPFTAVTSKKSGSW